MKKTGNPGIRESGKSRKRGTFLTCFLGPEKHEKVEKNRCVSGGGKKHVLYQSGTTCCTKKMSAHICLHLFNIHFDVNIVVMFYQLIMPKKTRCAFYSELLSHTSSHEMY